MSKSKAATQGKYEFDSKGFCKNPDTGFELETSAFSITVLYAQNRLGWDGGYESSTRITDTCSVSSHKFAPPTIFRSFKTLADAMREGGFDAIEFLNNTQKQFPDLEMCSDEWLPLIKFVTTAKTADFDPQTINQSKNLNVKQNEQTTTVAPSAAEFKNVLLKDISADPKQPRTFYDETAMQEFTDSVREKGVIQPFLLRPNGKGYLIVCGERRFRASVAVQKNQPPKKHKA